MLHQYKPLAITTHLNTRSALIHKSNVIRSHHFVTMAIAAAAVYKSVLSFWATIDSQYATILVTRTKPKVPQS